MASRAPSLPAAGIAERHWHGQPDVELAAAGWLPVPTRRWRTRWRSTTGAGDGSEAGLWDSGWVESTTTSARYRGRPLESRQAAFWSVRSRTASGGTSLWSERHYFQVGLLHRSDWSASWVAHPPLGAQGSPGAGGCTNAPPFPPQFRPGAPLVLL